MIRIILFKLYNPGLNLLKTTSKYPPIVHMFYVGPFSMKRIQCILYHMNMHEYADQGMYLEVLRLLLSQRFTPGLNETVAFKVLLKILTYTLTVQNILFIHFRSNLICLSPLNSKI